MTASFSNKPETIPDMSLNILVGCEESGTVRDAFAALRHKVLSCDLMPSRRDGPHYEGDIFDVIDYPWDLAIFHPPCTHTSVSGARHFAEKWMDGRQAAGVAFFMNLWRRSSHIKRRCFEQPVSVMSSLFRKPDQIIQPWMFGHFETKTTCLWLEELPPLTPTYSSIEECREALGLPIGTKPADRIHKMAPGPDRARERSKTFDGIADAMGTQWGGDLLSQAAA
jgi:hypothetical protein